MAELLVVADDLTGAADTAVHFARSGRPARVVVDEGGAEPETGDEPVLVVDTESRHLPAEEAGRRVVAAVVRGRGAGVRRFFKKTDSTLRGNLGAELAALLAASGETHLAYLPALPALGRTTRGGVQYLQGRPLHETDFARDPLEPVRDGSVPAAVRRQTDLPITLVAPATLRDPAAPLPAPGILVLDAETDDDLRAAVQWLERRGLLGAVAGTSALAHALAVSGGWNATAAPPPPALPSSPGPMLVVGGSLHPVSLDQLDRAAASGFTTVALRPEALLGDAVGAAETAVAAAAGHLVGGRSVLLRTPSGPAGVEACRALSARIGLPEGALHASVAAGAGRVAAAVLGRAPAGSLMVLGGDTLAGVVHALGGPALLPRWEALPGVPVSVVEGRPAMPLVSKAGGFGGENVIMDVRDAIREGRVR